MGSATILDGSRCAAVIQRQLHEIVHELKKGHRFVPHLDVLLIGDSAASLSYVTGKKKAAGNVGMTGTIHHYPASISLAEGICMLQEIQAQELCSGVLVQLPLPVSWNEGRNSGIFSAEQEMIRHILPGKDVDGFTVENQGQLFAGHSQSLKPCTPLGILALLKAYGLETGGKHVCVIGRSHIVGDPVSHLLSQKPQENYNLGLGDATVTQCNSRTRKLEQHCQSADILISATGKPNLVTAEMVRPGVILIDVGINHIADSSKKRGYRLVGDVDFGAVQTLASYITPVPKGVGPMTITMLLHNTIQAACQQRGLPIPELDWERIRREMVGPPVALF